MSCSGTSALDAFACTSPDELDALKELLSRREQVLFENSLGKASTFRTRCCDHAGRAEASPGSRELPIVEVLLVLDESNRDCPVCAGEFEEIEGATELRRTKVVERKFVTTRHLRQKY